MSRLANRRNLGLESLESREVMSAGGPSAEAQYMLELINQARTTPQAMADRVTSDPSPDVVATARYYGVDLNAVHDQISAATPRPPVAWSDTLASTATNQSLDQVRTGIQTHQGADGSSLSQRLDRAGYTDRVSSAENAYAYSQSVDHAMEAFMIDWGVADQGHRRNILQPDATPDQFYREVGIGIVDSSRSGFGPEVITQDFGTRAGTKPYLLGVAFNDANGNYRYDMNEGQGNVQIDAVNVQTGQTTSASSWDAGGGYQMQLDPGAYNVTARVGNRTVRSDRVYIGDQNVKVDYNLTNPGPSTVPVSTPAPVAPVVLRAQPTPVAPVSAWNTLSNASAAQTAQFTAPVQAQTLAAPVRANTARAGSSWLANWSSWTARRGW